ncbi:hypothetical protein PEQA60_39220 [Pseudomonas sp. Eqa60]|nr:putative lipoprotein [Pseudomonas protegens]BAO62802.1 lipoprotein [Pseudomonas protegens Cab57]BCQ69932.1 hypothetical protein PEQA60_39220 [Pseudomonas sp. Eqa60]GED77782.1 hypothetical protein PFL02_46320 [Pseudomonas fluorescens]VAV70140.1 hypothetical protein PPRCHA0_3838 [Pseudomonas protegens CHA0]
MSVQDQQKGAGSAGPAKKCRWYPGGHLGLNPGEIGVFKVHRPLFTRLTAWVGRGPGLAGICAFALVLTGCAAREPEVRTVRVEVPVQVPCRAPVVPVPAWATGSLKKTDSLELKVRALLAERRQRVGYERVLVAAVEACQ